MGLFRPAVLSENEQAEIVRAKLAWVVESLQPQEVWLFGSAAGGRLTEASDLDLALLYESEQALRAAHARLWRLPRRENWPHDLAFYTSDDFYARASIGGVPMEAVSEGVRLYPPQEVPT